MKPAQQVIEMFGGQSALAALLGKRQSTVQYWWRTGVIPPKWHPALIRLARERGIELAHADLVPLPDPPEPPATDGRLPEARHWGTLTIGGAQLPCYVLDDGRRVVSRNGATGLLTDNKGGGNLESYLRVQALEPYLPEDLSGQMVEFSIQNVVNKTVRGVEAETFLEICQAYVRAHGSDAPLTERQQVIAMKAAMFLAACAKVGLIALIDEATGYQYERMEDALQFKLKVFLEDEMRKWEPTFPNDLWIEFGRLTNWQGSVHQRPKYWGKLVMELVYEYLDKDVADWLRKNAPRPRHGQNYHQWLSSQYGLEKLIKHLWMLIGMARACDSMRELKERMAEQFGRQPVQLTLFAPPPSRILQERKMLPDFSQDVVSQPGETVHSSRAEST
jgi:hypothetical protein